MFAARENQSVKKSSQGIQSLREWRTQIAEIAALQLEISELYSRKCNWTL
jgi:hypothetical protein